MLPCILLLSWVARVVALSTFSRQQNSAPIATTISSTPTVITATRNNNQRVVHQHQRYKSNWQLHAVEIATTEKESDDTKIEQRNLRFAGVGRLFSTSPSFKENQDVQKEGRIVNDSDPHIQILERLSNACVVVVGLGGVGSWAAEALCRSGVGSIVMIDLDDICISNTNRQIHAMTTTVGKMKIDEMEQRLLNVNPDCNITLIHDFVSRDNIYSILTSLPTNATACLDAIDGASSKSALIATCAQLGIPLVTVGGSAGRTDPTMVVCEDLARAVGDPLLRACKKNLRREYGFEEGTSIRRSQSKTKTKPKRKQKWNIKAVVSTEPQKRVRQDSSSLRRCDGALGTACFVTGSFGFIAAGQIVDMIAMNNLVSPRGFRRKNQLRK